MGRRIQKKGWNAIKKNRGPEWTNIEEEKELSRHNVTGRVVVIDCVTLWCTNFFMEFDSNVASSLGSRQKRIRQIYPAGCHFHIRN